MKCFRHFLNSSYNALSEVVNKKCVTVLSLLTKDKIAVVTPSLGLIPGIMISRHCLTKSKYFLLSKNN